MRYFAKAVIEFVGVAMLIYLLLLLVASSIRGEPSAPPSQQEISLFSYQCSDRTVLIRSKLECRK